MADKPVLLGLTIATSLLAYKLYKDDQHHKISLPPSPRSYPLIGNLLSIPSEYEHLGFMQLGEQLGSSIFSLSAFGTTIVVLNDRDDATPHSTFHPWNTSKLSNMRPVYIRLNWGDFGSLIGYGDRWRKYRRLMTPWLNKQAITAYHGSQESATRMLLRRLLESHKSIMSSHDIEPELYLCISSTLLRSVYGYEAASPSDPFLVKARAAFAYIAQASLTSNYLVNIIPALRYVPDWFLGAGWKREAARWRKDKETLIDEIYKIGLENMRKDNGMNLIVGSLRNQALKLGLTEAEADDYVKQVSITMFFGGADTTVATLLMFFMAILLYPEVQQKAQAELDAVIGNSRFPTFEDRAQLGYVERIVQETLRWGPITPLAIPHTCFRDDTYKGYQIPKGTIVAGNVWAMTRDERVYKDPEVFNPDRNLDPSTPPSPVFGWGRRHCPGVHFGEASLFITIASILMTFDIGVRQDRDGEDILPRRKMVNSIVLTPELYMIKLTPRSTTHAELIRHGC